MFAKHLLKRGALLAAANWPLVAIQFVASTTFEALLAVPVVGAAILVAVLLGADLAELLQGSIRDIVSTLAAALMAEPVALAAFAAAFALVAAGGSVLMILVKGGVVEVLVAAHRVAGPIEHEPLTLDTVTPAAQFTLERFTGGCGRLFRRYLALGALLLGVYAATGGAYLGLVIYGYRAFTGGAVLGWTFVAALSTLALVGWITVVNLFYLLVQIAVAVDGRSVADALATVPRFVRAELRRVAAVLGVMFALLVAATLASALAWSGVGLIAFVPLVGLAVFPLQLVALLVRGLVFQYLGLTALGAFVTLYVDFRGHAAGREAARPSSVATPLGYPA